MSLFNPSIQKDDLKESSGGNFITASGIYDVTLKHVSVVQGNENAVSLNFNVVYNGQEQTIYGLGMTNKDGSENFGYGAYKRLLTILGLEGQVGEPEVMTVPLGKDKTPTDLAILTELCDREVKVHVKYEYDRYKGNIKEKRNIVTFFRISDGASASEIAAETGYGDQLKQTIEGGYDTKYRLTNGVTEAEVTAFKNSFKNKGKANTSNQPTATATAPRTSFPAATPAS